ncbi:MAG: PilZ domain-containing protein, partial [Phycisphaeraceae bacterium]
MSAISEPSRDQRQHPRIKVPAMYTLIRARVLGSNRYNWTGHIYDVSLGGVRFELDMPIEPGTQLEIRGMLPGAGHTTFRAIGRVVRVHSDASELGPAIMGLQFESFQSPMDRHRLAQYIDARAKAEQSALRRA